MDTNITGTLNLLEEAVAAGVGRFVFTSSTTRSAVRYAAGRARPRRGSPRTSCRCRRTCTASTKVAAEDLCELVHRDHGLPCVICARRASSPSPTTATTVRAAYDDLNLKVNELLYRRVDLEDVVSAHRLALDRAPEIGFAR